MRVYSLQEVENLYPVVYKNLKKKERAIAKKQIELYKPFDSNTFEFFESWTRCPIEKIEIFKSPHSYSPREGVLYRNVEVKISGTEWLLFPLASDEEEVSIKGELRRSSQWVPDSWLWPFDLWWPTTSMRWEVSDLEVLKVRDKYAKVAMNLKVLKLNRFRSPSEYWWTTVVPVLDGYEENFSDFDVARTLLDCEMSLEPILEASSELGQVYAERVLRHISNMWRMLCLRHIEIPYRDVEGIRMEDPETVLFATYRGTGAIATMLHRNRVNKIREKFGTTDLSKFLHAPDGPKILDEALSCNYKHDGRVELIVRIRKD
ncbi:MAG: hypothetical protein DRP63_00780 [Planctomycetota bacterium]|nr:MAG: hypothetical protein DRP63_00780 [Planctomycetota bacterium]